MKGRVAVAAQATFLTLSHRLRRTELSSMPRRNGEDVQMDCPPSLYEPDQLERVLDSAFSTTVEEQMEMLRETHLLETPMTIQDLGPAVAAGGQIFADGRRYYLSSRRLAPADIVHAEEISEPVLLVSSARGLRYFGHWLRDDCAAFEAVRETTSARVLSLPRPDWPDARAYEDAFEQNWEERVAFRTPSLSLVRDIGFSADKRRRMEILRARLRKKFTATAPGGIAYIARGPGGKQRDVSNEEELIGRLEREGVDILHAEQGDLIPRLLDARLVITVEGSQAAHAVYTMAGGGGLLVLQPPRRFFNPHAHWTRLLGMRYAIVVGEADGDASFRVYPDEVLAMSERLLDVIDTKDV